MKIKQRYMLYSLEAIPYAASFFVIGLILITLLYEVWFPGGRTLPVVYVG